MLAECNNQAAKIAIGQIPTADEATASYTTAGGHLSPMMQFGADPLAYSCELIELRQREMEQNIPTPEELFAFTVNGNYIPFAQSLQFLIKTTKELQRLL